MTASLLSRWPLIVLGCAGAAAYANSFAGVFLFDDHQSIVQDSRLADVQTFLANLPGMIRPLFKATLLVDRLAWGLDPTGYHLLNLALHLGSGLLLYAIVQQLVDEVNSSRAAAETSLVPLGAALLFLVHPLGTETVTYLSGRATGLASFWYLAALLLYVHASRPGRDPRLLSKAHAGAIGCFALALLSKETAITFPLALLLTEIVARRTRGSDLRAIVTRLHTPFWAVLFVFLAAALMTPRYRFLLDQALSTRPFYEHFVSQLNVIAYAATLVVTPSRMNVDHDFPHYTSLLAWPAPLSLALILGLIALAIGRARAQPLLAFGILWFFLQLLATNSVLQRADLLSERNLYLPAAGLFLALSSAWFALAKYIVDRVSEPRGPVRLGLGALPIVVVAVFLSATGARNAIYSDPVVFWTDAVNKSPAKPRPHVNLGQAYVFAGDLPRATDQFRTALALDPDNPAAQKGLRAAWERGSDTPGVAAAR